MSDSTHIGFLGDESGSMSGNQAAMVEGFNEFVANTRKNTEGKEVRLTLGFFDLGGQKDILRIKYDGPITESGELSKDAYHPRGSTPLNDATIKMISHMEKADADKRLLVIFTDGYENASEASTSDVRKIIAEKEQDGWEFIYLGANQDAWAEGQSRGVGRTSSFNTTASPEGTKTMMRSMGAVAAMRVNLEPGEYVVQKDQLHAQMGGTIPESDIDTPDGSGIPVGKVTTTIGGKSKKDSISKSAIDKAQELISR